MPNRPALSFRLFALLTSTCASLLASPTQTIVHNFSSPPRGNGSQESLVTDAAGNFYGSSYDGGAHNLGVVFKLSPTGAQTVLHSFAGGTADGAYPSSAITLDSVGNLYGTTFDGGLNNLGVVYKLSADGEESILHSFAGNTDGANPSGGVVLDAAGNLYGTTQEGGSSMGTFDAGVVYKLDPSGTETLLHTFSALADGASPLGGVTLDKQGNLYGPTISGGAHNAGVIFKITSAGKESILYNFTGGADGAYASSRLTLDANGNLYGTTQSGGLGSGVVYTLNPGGKQTVLYSFTDGNDGGYPNAGVVLDPKGNLYGTTPEGGVGGFGVVYQVTPGGKETVLYSFSATAVSQGQDSDGGVIFGTNGHLYGATVAGGSGGTGVVYEIIGLNQETVLSNFPDAPGGFTPQGKLLRDQAGDFYGANSDGGTGFGVVYRISTSGQESVIHTFTGGLDGGFPLSGLTPDSAGNLYGTTIFGGAANAGVVYKIDLSGNLTTLYSFTGQADGGEPNSGVTLDPAGNVYGSTSNGGSSNLGVVYQVNPAGVETVLHSFTGGSDGQYPQAPVARDAAGNLYGTASGGGLANAGVVYRVTPGGEESVLYSFTGQSDGGTPLSGVVLDSAGDLYGTTANGGTNFSGVVFKLAGTAETVLFSFDYTDGAFPRTLVRDSAGNLYGATTDGGTDGDGVVFQIAPDGTETTLLTFAGTNGALPNDVALASDGTLYGATFEGGSKGGGVVYELRQ